MPKHWWLKALAIGVALFAAVICCLILFLLMSAFLFFFGDYLLR